MTLKSTPPLSQLLAYESRFRLEGRLALAGVDEAGRGPLAGPVVAAAVILPLDQERLNCLEGLTDSKALSAKQRDRFFPLICEQAEAVGLGLVSVPVIDRINILQATFLAMRRALACLERVDQVLVDGPWPIPGLSFPQLPLVRGDSLSLSIAAASVVAKVFRDRLMTALASHYPAYSFQLNKGYGTAAHRRAIQEGGLSPLHRRSFCGRLRVRGE